MPISAGDRLGPYEILAPIGAGGMGEVYRARDTRLGREVAVKISKESFTERFEREARSIAALNHTNVCHLYDVGPNYLVMEYVEGQTLSALIKGRSKAGTVALDEALPIVQQLIDGIEAAHEKNIIHRDLKPANIKITPEGVVKILDFGLAKRRDSELSSDGGSSENSPTVTIGATEAGVILGTASYMAPEQAKGKTADRRCDIWSFGVVVYELLTGRRPFDGETTVEILGAVLNKEPDWTPVPERMRRLLQRCLQKDRKLRLGTIGDARWMIEESSASAAAPVSASATAEPRRQGWMPLGWAFACIFAAAMAGLAVWFLKPTPPKPVSRFAMALPPGQRVFPQRPEIAISPDGSRLVYSAGPGNTATQLYLRAMDGLEAHAIPGTEGAYGPFFSPDGQWVGFSQGAKLTKVSLNGGPPVNLADTSGAGGALGASWGQGTIAFSPVTSSPIQQVSDAGGNVQPLTHLETADNSHVFPDLLPNAAGLLFGAGPTAATSRVAVQSLKTGERRDLFPAGIMPRYAPSGHIAFLQAGNLMAAPFDVRSLKATGPAVPVVEGVMPFQYSFSSTGTLVYIPGSSQAPQLKLVWVDRNGKEQALPAAPHNYVMPRISPDGRRVAAGLEEADSQIWIYDLTRDTLTRLTFAPGNNIDPLWTPDGKRIVFKGNGNRLYWQPADGSGAAEALTDGNLSSNDIPGSFSPDGETMAIVESAPAQSVWILPLRDRKAQLFERGETNETAPRFSPDGHWLAYTSAESGRNEIYARPYPGPGGKYQISTEGGTEPVWNPKGRELFYRAGNKMMAVDVSTQPGFSAGKPRVLFEGAYVPTPRSFPNYDVSPDGQRFLMVKATELGQAPTQINVVLNWFEELKRRVPARSK
ncbi:MAG TPA: protein kinase [Bryobacteraceae bacterium]|nr:protein kinase [Bryobacteraceae bacterium]